GPAVMTAMITWKDSWRLGYLAVAMTLFALSLLFIATRLQWDNPGQTVSSTSGESETVPHVTAVMALRNQTVWLHILLFFIYTGLEVSLGQWSFTVLTESRNVPRELAGIYVTIYWASILGGRILFGFVVDRIGIDKLISLSTMSTLARKELFAWNYLHQISHL